MGMSVKRKAMHGIKTIICQQPSGSEAKVRCDIDGKQGGVVKVDSLHFENVELRRLGGTNEDPWFFHFMDEDGVCRIDEGMLSCGKGRVPE
jgi:hypothetical protein